MKIFTIIFFIFASNLAAFGQTREEILEDLKTITNLEEAKKYSKAHPTWLAHIHTISKRDSLRYSEVLNMEMNKEFIYRDTKRDISLAGKVFLKYEEEVYDIQYVYLDGSKLNEQEIDSIRKEIFKKYEQGISFDSLVSQYSMDGMPNGEIFEIQPESLVKEVNDECIKHNAGDIFTADVPDNNWYYVILKKRDLYSVEFTKFLSVKFKQ